MEAIKTVFHASMDPMKSFMLANHCDLLSDAKDIFTLLWDTKESSICYTVPFMPRNAKSDMISNQNREEGNRFYKAGCFDNALKTYNSSIRMAEHPDIKISSELDSTDVGCEGENAHKISCGVKCFPSCSEDEMKNYKSLGMAYANRSAVYMVKKDYDRCISDIYMALKYGYPSEFKQKLEERRDKCLKMKDKLKGKATSTFQDVFSNDKRTTSRAPYASTLSGVTEVSCSSTRLRRASSTAKDIQEFLCGRKTAHQDVFNNNEGTPPNLLDHNPDVPAFSSAVEITYSSNKGRHVTAIRDIQPGELIAVEKSYCSSLYHVADKDFYCIACLMFCQRQVPCPTCSLVAFCSDHCRAKGMKEHKKECTMFNYLFDLNLEDDVVTRLAVMILVHTTYENLKSLVPILKKEMEDLPSKKYGFNEEYKYISSDYRTVYHMVNTRSHKLNHRNIDLGLKALIIIKILEKKGDFFVTKNGQPFKPNREDLILAGEVLLRHMIYNINVIGLYDIKLNPRSGAIAKKMLGVGIFPSIILLRHSCNPPVSSYNFGHTKIIRAVLPIKKGQEVTMAHTNRYLATPYGQRQAYLEIIGFKCACEACVGLWPCADELSLEIIFKCLSCSGSVIGERNEKYCQDCKMSYRKDANKNNAMVQKWHSISEQVLWGDLKVKCLEECLRNGKKATQSDYDFLCHQTILVGEYVQQPSVMQSSLRNFLLSLFYMGL